ncbi:hypothetical protein G6F57_014919 [Rhizopus arrhizus]|uniref:Uncharacterized protein n=1 Tax=Rhizopus oryzae TaxID=64495 RepID=A0A9P7BLE7_RHIOR|nr:hypothetical protein G6F23_011208 [Rhizopus arrhizus]KAG1394101.1 hypothetical protein G6F58_012180 [Rhizopus delemar]KAG0753674.1 hypothetical protein G6F24_012857 [Rhizopus arrhizus]KAG0775186.1 hypothetical protein G6F22_013487 [Rhizopus arrhizus]KAG0779341.1 hypothetical protein G6F21_012626 [Rhizopus arrhizus]
MPLSQQPLITEFLKAKRKLTVKVPEQHEQEIWDIQILIDRVKTWGENDQLSLQLLQQKTLILLGIATMWRSRSDLGRLQHRDMSFQFQDKALSGATLLSRQPKEAQHKHQRLE